MHQNAGPKLLVSSFSFNENFDKTIMDICITCEDKIVVSIINQFGESKQRVFIVMQIDHNVVIYDN